MATLYGPSTYAQVFEDAISDLNEGDRLSGCSPETYMKWILQGCQRVSQRVTIHEYIKLRLIQGQDEYLFADTDTPVTGSGTVDTTANLNTLTGTTAVGAGTISSDGSTVTGVGTLFASELALGVAFIVGTEVLTVMEIHSNTECVLSGGFVSDIAAGTAFSYSNTKFSRELSEGSTITIGANSGVVDTITNPYQVVLVSFFAATNAAQAFTIDRKVTEIPTKFDVFQNTSRTEGSYTLTPQVVPINTLERMKRNTGPWGGYTNLSEPLFIAPTVNSSGRRCMVIYPSVGSDKDITLYGIVRIRPEFYTPSITSASFLPIDGRYDGVIREFVKARIWGWLKEHKLRAEQDQIFERLMGEVSRADASPVSIQIDTE